MLPSRHLSVQSYSFVPNCRRKGEGCKFLEKNSASPFNYYERMTSKNTPILRNLDNFPWCSLFDPPYNKGQKSNNRNTRRCEICSKLTIK